MEPVQIIEQQPTEELNVKIKKIGIVKLLPYLLIAVLATSFAFVGYNTYLLNNKYKSLESKIENDVSQISDLKNKVDSLKIDNINTKLSYLDSQSFWSKFQHDIESGIVTDDLTVEKASLNVFPKIKESDKEYIYGTIDVYTQPQYSLKYQGQAKFSVSDRELKNTVKELIDAVGTRYSRSTSFRKDMPQWDTAEITVTIKNYEIGTYKNGTMKLKGE